MDERLMWPSSFEELVSEATKKPDEKKKERFWNPVYVGCLDRCERSHLVPDGFMPIVCVFGWIAGLAVCAFLFVMMFIII